MHQGEGAIFTGEYTADGERISVSEGNQSRLSSFRLFDDAYGNGANTPITHTPGLAQRKNGSDRLYSTEHLGSTRYLTGTDPLDPDYKFGARYDAYGQRTASAGPDGPDATPRQYAGAWGYERTGDTLGLDYLYHRYYDPAVGRFISRDPIGWAGGLNLYGYVENDPVGSVDPSGLSASPAIELSSGNGTSYSVVDLTGAGSLWSAVTGRDWLTGGKLPTWARLLNGLSITRLPLARLRLPKLRLPGMGSSVRHKRGSPVLPDAETDLAYEWALSEPQQRACRVVEKYNIKLRAGGKEVKLVYDPTFPWGKYGSVRKNEPNVIRYGKQALVSEEALATTIAHELRHARAYNGSGSNSEKAATKSEAGLRQFIRGRR